MTKRGNQGIRNIGPGRVRGMDRMRAIFSGEANHRRHQKVARNLPGLEDPSFKKMTCSQRSKDIVGNPWGSKAMREEKNTGDSAQTDAAL